MSLKQPIRSKSTKEAGLAFVNRNKKRIEEFLRDKRGSFIYEIKIVRGKLVKAFYDASNGKVEYIFGDHVTALKQGSGKVSVTFPNSPEREYDLVIGADGMDSKIRRLVLLD
jgi:2-polyprenyl-6-methoxyphenol hydroxylase-like FAD-dependent oxidoreductase